MPQSQTDKSLRPIVIPDVIDNPTAMDRFKHFHSQKMGLIKTVLGNRPPDDCIRYRTGPFLDLLRKIIAGTDASGMKVYFACYTSSGDAAIDSIRIPKGKEGYLTLVYATTIDDHIGTDLKDKGDYYIFNAENGNPEDGQFTQIGQVEAFQWINTFQKGGMLYKLNSGMGSLGDTKSLWYKKPNVQITVDGISPIDPAPPHITVFFGAYKNPEKDTVDLGAYNGGMTTITVSNQLTIIFGTGKTPIKDQTSSFFKRIYKKVKSLVFANIDPVNYDTGAPCPPATGCI